MHYPQQLLYSLGVFCCLIHGSLMAQRYETQSFTVLKPLSEQAQLRYYPSVMKIEAADENGFRQLFGFISGQNSENRKIEMTTPVYRQGSGEQKTMAFVLPKRFKAENTPKPQNKAVRVLASAAGYFMAYTYTGYTSPAKEKAALEQLRQLAEKHSLTIIGPPNWLFYNAPYQFWNRKNELLLEIIAPQP
ncbi:MAG: SOUL family heme-binding protein [Flavobacteriaceae bacterium]